MRRPRDPVAAHLLRRHPDLTPQRAMSSVLTMIRARATLVDRLLADEIERVKASGKTLELWSVGSGFDARWYRLKSVLGEVVKEIHEVEIPEVISLKESLLEGSTFFASWKHVQRHALVTESWAVSPKRTSAALILLEGVSTRLEPEALAELLKRLREQAPKARIVLDLPGYVSMLHAPGEFPMDVSGAEWAPEHGDAVSNPYRWSRNLLRQLGWEIDEDIWLASRPHLRTPTGGTLCPGMEALRVIVLRPFTETTSGIARVQVRG